MSATGVRKIEAPVYVEGDLTTQTGIVNGRNTANDGATLDAHVADTAKHAELDDNATSSSKVWSSQKTSTELASKAASSHTHPSSEISDLSTTTVPEGDNLYHTTARVNAVIDSRRGAALGVASLNASGKVPASQIEVDGGVTYQGTWNASTNTPTLTDGSGQKGEYYVVSTTGSTEIDGISDWSAGDWIISNAAGTWEKSDHTDQVTKVNNKDGNVTLDTDDIGEGSTNQYYTAARVDARLATKTTSDLAEGTNKYYTDARVAAHSDVAASVAHAADADKHREIDDAGAVSTTKLWSSSKIDTELSGKAASSHTHLSSHITDLDTSQVPENGNLYHTSARVDARIDVHSDVVASVSHAADADKHREIDDAGGVATTKLWSSSKINTELGTKADVFDEELHSAFFDDFMGDGVSTHWTTSWSSATSSVSHVDGVGGLIRLASGGATNDYAELQMVRTQVAVVPDSRLKFRVRANHGSGTRIELGARVDANQSMRWLFDSDVSSNWHCENTMSGTSTSTDSTVASDTSWHVLEINTSSGQIKFVLDGTVRATHTTNLPTAAMHVYARQTSLSNSARNSDIDFVKLLTDRDGSGGGNDAGGDAKCIIC